MMDDAPLKKAPVVYCAGRPGTVCPAYFTGTFPAGCGCRRLADRREILTYALATPVVAVLGAIIGATTAQRMIR